MRAGVSKLFSAINRKPRGAKHHSCAEHISAAFNFHFGKGVAWRCQGLNSNPGYIREKQLHLLAFLPKIWIERAIHFVFLSFISVEQHKKFLVCHYTRPGHECQYTISKLRGRSKMFAVTRNVVDVLTPTSKRNRIPAQLC